MEDIPDTVDVLALFIARAVVDEILPPAFLTKERKDLSEDSKGIQVIKRAEKGYVSAPLHAEIILRKWGGSKSTIVDDIKANINDLLIEYITSGDKKEACSCVKNLKVPFFHHDIVNRALILAMERRPAEGLILDLIKVAYEEGIINVSQISKEFNRLIDTIDDLCHHIPSARSLLQPLIFDWN
ncbi:programmed cell death protein 4-like [Asparagus officinalis]|uniref:programmed cell death protein 4-like n=1 Tax=Asparagus officinalis TaxID=4686 RepID=UPI00098E173A|nr:programmed cell death protein 4-like [Asparagus officinalis]